MTSSNKKTIKSAQFSTWRNDKDVVARFKFMTNEKNRGAKNEGDGSIFEEVELKPGEEITLPSEFDNAIRKVKNGVVMQGACPWLTKVGETATVHEALDFEKAIQDEEVMKIAAEMEKESYLAKALEEMQKRRAKFDGQALATKPKVNGK